MACCRKTSANPTAVKRSSPPGSTTRTPTRTPAGDRSQHPKGQEERVPVYKKPGAATPPPSKP